MNHTRYLIRISIVLVVTGILFGFLQLPHIIDRFKSQQSINVLTFPNVIDSEYFEEFEKETGTIVNISYFDTYEELVIKMRSGSADYDLIMLADYALSLLTEKDLLKQIDHNKLTFKNEIYPLLLGLPYDPANAYSIPYSWEIFGLGLNTKALQKMPEASWKLLFDSSHEVGMLDDAREVVSIAALYLFGPTKTDLTPADLQQIKKLLLAQKKKVVMYTDLRTDYLLISQSAPLVLGLSSDIYLAMRHDSSIQFMIPKEGSFIVIDAFAIPVSTKKDDQVYAFLNYLFQPHIMKKYARRYNFFPAVKNIVSELDPYFMVPSKSLFSRLRHFSYSIPEQELRDVWISLKS